MPKNKGENGNAFNTGVRASVRKKSEIIWKSLKRCHFQCIQNCIHGQKNVFFVKRKKRSWNQIKINSPIPDLKHNKMHMYLNYWSKINATKKVRLQFNKYTHLFYEVYSYILYSWIEVSLPCNNPAKNCKESIKNLTKNEIIILCYGKLSKTYPEIFSVISDKKSELISHLIYTGFQSSWRTRSSPPRSGGSTSTVDLHPGCLRWGLLRWRIWDLDMPVFSEEKKKMENINGTLH